MKSDVVIVGSGISGLTAAAILARKGKKVSVVEAQSSFGGSLRQFKRGGIGFDVGFHYTGCVADGEILDLLWRFCGVQKNLDIITLGDNSYDWFEFNEGASPVKGYFSYEKFTDELCRCFPGEIKAIKDYFSTVKTICSDVPFYHTDLPLTPFLRGYKPRPTSLLQFLDGLTGNPYLKSVLTAPGFLYGAPSSQASIDVHALVAHGYYAGASTVGGGGQAIVDAFLEQLKGLGVELFSGLGVEKIVVENGQVAGVETSDAEIMDCDHVIYTAHPATLVDRVPSGVFRPAYLKRLANLKNSLSMFGVFGKSEYHLDTLQGPLNYYVIPGETDVLPVAGTLPHQQRPMMLTSTRTDSLEDLQRSQNGIILLRLGYWQDVERFALSSSGKRSPEYENYKNEVAQEMVKTAEMRWGDVVGSITPLAVGTPLTFRDELLAPEGCAYGAMHCLDQFNPDVRTRLPGLMLAGQSTLMTGVAGASISGLVAAGEILGLETLWEDVKQCN